MKTKKIIIILLILSFTFKNISYAITPDEEVEIGRKTANEISKFFDFYEDEEIQKYVSSVGERLVKFISDPEFKYSFKVVKSSQINAFALPGGFIYVTTGLLTAINSEAELAGILGHEIGHVTAHHSAKQRKKAMAGMVAMLGAIAASVLSPQTRDRTGELLMMTNSLVSQILMGYGREAEIESDRLGLIYSFNAGYNPLRMVDFLRNLQFQEMIQGRSYHGFYATHPDTKMRIITAYDMASGLIEKEGKKEVAHDKYIKKLKGLLYGGPKDKNDNTGKLKKRYIDIYTVKKDDTFNSIAKNKMNNIKESFILSVINNKKENEKLKPGELIKIIVNKKPKVKK